MGSRRPKIRPQPYGPASPAPHPPPPAKTRHPPHQPPSTEQQQTAAKWPATLPADQIRTETAYVTDIGVRRRSPRPSRHDSHHRRPPASPAPSDVTGKQQHIDIVGDVRLVHGTEMSTTRRPSRLCSSMMASASANTSGATTSSTVSTDQLADLAGIPAFGEMHELIADLLQLVVVGAHHHVGSLGDACFEQRALVQQARFVYTPPARRATTFVRRQL